MYLRFPIFKLLSSVPKLYLLHFKKLLWCLLNVSFCHNNFVKLHRSQMNLNPFEIFSKTCKAMSTTVSQNFSSFDFIKWKILLFSLKSPQIGTWTQNDLQLAFSNSKLLEILGDTLDICLLYLFKLLALLMMTTKSYHFQKKLTSKLRLKF